MQTHTWSENVNNVCTSTSHTFTLTLPLQYICFSTSSSGFVPWHILVFLSSSVTDFTLFWLIIKLFEGTRIKKKNSEGEEEIVKERREACRQSGLERIGAEMQRARRTMGAYSMSTHVRPKALREPRVVNHQSCTRSCSSLTLRHTHRMNSSTWSSCQFCQTLLFRFLRFYCFYLIKRDNTRG